MIKKHLSSGLQVIERTPTGKHLKHPIAVPAVVTVFMMIFFSVLFLLYGGQTLKDADIKRVEVSVDGQARTVPTRATTVNQLLERIGVKLQEEDIVEPGLNSPISDEDFKVSVYRAKPVTVIDENSNR